MNCTVIIPTRNRSDLLKRALASLPVKYQAVVVDDASARQAREENRQICRSRAHTNYLCQEFQKGAAEARNRGVAQADCDWICFLDDDDQLTPGYLAKMEALSCRFPEVDAWVPDVKSGKRRPRSEVSLKKLLRRNQVGGCSGLCIRTVCFESVGGFDVNFPSMQDWDLWLRLSRSNKLYYSGISGVVYDRASSGKITHDLQRKYRGLRRLYFKHTGLWPKSDRKHHLLRCRVLRRLLNEQTGLWLNFKRAGFSPAALYYTCRWRPFAARLQAGTACCK